MKKLFYVLAIAIFLFACTAEENSSQVTDILRTDDVSILDINLPDTGKDVEPATICSTGEELSIEKPEIVSGATIDYEFGTIKMSTGGSESGPAEKTQFDVILKSSGGAKNIISDENGRFGINITEDELKKLPENFEIVFIITPPENFGKEVKVNKSVVSFYRYGNIREFNFILSYSGGYFVIDLDDQLYKLYVKKGDAKKALDAFITATTKAAVEVKSEPVPGAEITVEQVPGPTIINEKKNKKKSLYFSDTNTNEDIIVNCYEFESGREIVTTTNNEGYFSFKTDISSEQPVLLTITPPKNSEYTFDVASILIHVPLAEMDIYDYTLTYEKPENETAKGKFIVVGPISKQPCSELWNPICEEKKCKTQNGQMGKCQFLYDSNTGKYKCGCSVELCNADCAGNCKMPDGKEGVCHTEEIITNTIGSEVHNKQCVCGPINLDCQIPCQTDQDCSLQTGGQLQICATDLNGNKFCTRACDSAEKCPSPFSMCAKMGPDGRGICICPCIHADIQQAQCNPIGLLNQHCSDVTYGLLTDCIDINNNSTGECSRCCNEDKDCPSGLHCYDLPVPMNENCKRACMCKEPPVLDLCKECSDNSDCAPIEECVDEDNNPNTPKVCTVPCGPLGVCPSSPVFTYCDYNVGKYCICKHPAVSVDCKYECTDNQDCITNSNGQFDLCMPDANGIKRCTKSCIDAKECPSPYSLCVQYGDESYCVCPCIHFDTDNLSCTQYGMNITQCITKTNNSLPDCYDVDNDGTGECTHCCNDNKECPENMICTPAPNAKCDKVCTCKEHPIADVCQKCSQNSDCPSGFECADDDNNSSTPNVCTRVCPSIYPCPTSPVYTYCDNNISKYCICNNSGANLCDTKCENDSDCPNGFYCVDDDVNPLTPKICTKPCAEGCQSPMICNNDANLPIAICMCPRSYCKTCKEDIDCGAGLVCIDSDGDPLTPNVCTKNCSSDYECPVNLSCNLETKSCDCNRCSMWSNPKCEPLTCYNNGNMGKCQFVENKCDCVNEVKDICKECIDDFDCTTPLKCVDADNDPNTPKICSEPCPQLGCPSPSICDYGVSKYCFCK